MMAAVELSFVANAGLTSRAIEFFGAGGFSHVDNIVPLGLLGARSDRVGGKGPGVQIRPDPYEKWPRRVIMSLECTLEQRSAWIDFLESQIGKPYDKLAIVGFMIGRNWREEDAWFCSELSAKALEASGIFPHLELTPNKITPGALALAVSAAGGKVVKA